MPRLVLNAATVTLTLAVAASLSARALSLPVSNSIESRHADKGRYHPLPRDAEGGSLQTDQLVARVDSQTRSLGGIDESVLSLPRSVPDGYGELHVEFEEKRDPEGHQESSKRDASESMEARADAISERAQLSDVGEHFQLASRSAGENLVNGEVRSLHSTSGSNIGYHFARDGMASAGDVRDQWARDLSYQDIDARDFFASAPAVAERHEASESVPEELFIREPVEDSLKIRDDEIQGRDGDLVLRDGDLDERDGDFEERNIDVEERTDDFAERNDGPEERGRGLEERDDATPPKSQSPDSAANAASGGVDATTADTKTTTDKDGNTTTTTVQQGYGHPDKSLANLMNLIAQFFSGTKSGSGILASHTITVAATKPEDKAQGAEGAVASAQGLSSATPNSVATGSDGAKAIGDSAGEQAQQRSAAEVGDLLDTRA